MSLATTRRTKASVKSSSKISSKISPEQLADQLAASLAISSAKGKGKAAAVPLSADEQRLSAMRAVNLASQRLSAIAQSGWKRPSVASPLKSIELANVTTSANSAAISLNELRSLIPGDVDVERAASSVVGKLVALEMFDLALPALSEMYPRICQLCGAEPLTSTTRLSPPLHLLSVTLPDCSLDTTVQTLISTYLYHSIAILSHVIFRSNKTNDLVSLSATLLTAPTLLAWMPSLSAPSKHTDSILTRTYTQIIRSSSGCELSPSALFDIRAYALDCLAHTSPGTVEPDTFWDQAVKLGGILVKLSRDSQDEIARDVVRKYSSLVSHIEKRSDRRSFLSGRGYLTFCEYWMGFAKRASDIVTLNYVADMIRATQMTSPPSTSSSSPLSSSINDEVVESTEAVVLESAKVCAILSQATALLEQRKTAASVDLLARLNEVEAVLRKYGTKLFGGAVGVHTGNTSSHSNEPSGKVARALERTRRAAVKFIDDPALTPMEHEELISCVRSLLKEIVSIMELQTKSHPSTDLFTQSLDTLFVLARTTLKAADPRTYGDAYDYLTKAVSIAGYADLKADESDKGDRANYVRCISGAFHNLSGTLYQAQRHGAAIRFLKSGCELGTEALLLQRAHNASFENLEEGWRQLEQQLYRRWELLGACYLKIGDRKLAHGAFTQSIVSFPFAKMVFMQKAGSSGLSTIYSEAPELKQLLNIIERTSYLGANELFLQPSQVSLKSYLTTLDSAAITGAILESQIESLEGNIWKDGVLAAVLQVLNDAATIYGEEMPIRKARVLVRCLNLAYRVGPEACAVLGTPDEVGLQIQQLLQRKSFNQDSELMQFRSEHLASMHIWLALHAHRRADKKQSELIKLHIDEACKLLKSSVSGTPSVGSPVAIKKSPPKGNPVARKIASTRAAASRRGGAVKKVSRTAPRDPVTPKAPARKVLEAISLNVVSPPRVASDGKKLITFDDFSKLFSLLNVSAKVLGLLGLTLAKISVLDVTRRVCERRSAVLNDDYVATSTDLAYEYFKLGKFKRASTLYSQILPVIRSGQISNEISTTFFLRHAESLAMIDNVPHSISSYNEALELADDIAGEDKSMSSSQRIHMRVSRLEKAAMAAYVFSAIQYSKENVAVSLTGMLQSLRLWNRAVDTLTRLTPPLPSKSEAESNPFEMSSLNDALPTAGGASCVTEQPEPKKTFLRRSSMTDVEWRISEGLLATLFALSQTYFTRGSAREAEYFAQQAHDLASSLNAPASVSRALARKGEVQLYQGELEKGYETLVQAAEALQDLPGADAVNIRRLRGEWNQRSARDQDAQQLFEEARGMLDDLDRVLSIIEGNAFGPRKSAGLTPTSGQEVVVPTLLAAVLRQHIWLLRDEPGDNLKTLLDRFLSLPASSHTKAEENALMAKLTMHDVYERFRSDMFLSSLAESTIALPMGVSSSKLVPLSSSTQEILAALDSAEALFWADLALVARRGDVTHVREAAVSLTLIRVLQTSLGKSGAGARDPTLAVSLLDVSAAITLRREMLETISHKFLDLDSFDDLQWPLMSDDGTLLPRPLNKRARIHFSASSDSDDEPADADTAPMKAYWESVRAKYAAQTLDAPSLSASQTAALPKHWTVVHVTVTEDKSTLFIARQRGDDDGAPLVFCVPLKGRRDSSAEESEEHLAFDDALAELREIVRLSDEGTRGAVHVKSDDAGARAKWWRERAELDRRMRELVENIEFCWLGVFKTILSPRTRLSPAALADLSARFDAVFQRSLRTQDTKVRPSSTGASAPRRKAPAPAPPPAPQHVALDTALIECFAALPATCRDEELEDLAYFVLDLYQFHGVPVAIAEVDVDQVVVDLRTVLEERTARRPAAAGEEGAGDDDEHTFLVLDRHVQGIPWESLPVLRGRSVSRVPSVDFLLDRVELARLQRAQAQRGASADGAVDRAAVDPRKGYYILNPSGDLGKTEGRFKEWTAALDRVGWEGVVGKPPSEQQFLDALARKDLVVYFGHGGGEQYVRAHKIRHLPRCGAAMLWGCSSGALREMGDFDRVGTPLNYMLAGCPTLVANLWDVTDRDIDKFSHAVFAQLRMGAADVGQRGWGARAGGEGVSVVRAVAQAREACKLPYLTGAAPVVYGIPFYL